MSWQDLVNGVYEFMGAPFILMSILQLHKDKKVKGDYDTRFPQIGDRSASPDEDAQEVTIYSNLLAIEHTLETRLQEINEALEKINKHSEDFGLCEICKKPIELLRLKTNPASKTCINCATKTSVKPAS